MSDKRWHALGGLLILVAIGVSPALLQPGAAWVLTMALMASFIALVGHSITGLWRGALIDDRNKISLSRFQMLLWTIVILSAYLVGGLGNIYTGQGEPLSITLPQQLWLLMGISTTSLIGSPLIKSTKKDNVPEDAEMHATVAALAVRRGISPKQIATQGQVVVNLRPQDSSWSDLFQGEETGNAATLDLAKIQMFYFTLVLGLAYAIGLAVQFGHGPFRDFPGFSQGMLALLGISHGGYLTHKAIPLSQSQSA